MLHDVPRMSTVGRAPPAGSQPSETAKVRISMSPIQKVGTEKPRIEKAMIDFESALCGR